MILAVAILDQAGRQLGGFLPRLGGALLLLVGGLVLAALFGRVVRRSLEKVGLDRLAERWGVPPILERAGLGASLARLFGLAVRITITVVSVFAALSLLGLQFLSESLNAGVLFLPKLLLGGLLLLAGLVIAAFVRERAERTSVQLDLPIAIGPIVQGLVIAIFAITAAAQVTVSIALLMVILAIGLGALAATLTLAFGLGTREIARALSSARYTRAAYRPGQTIRVNGMRGRIERLEATAAILSADGETIRVPNHVLVEEVVVIEEGAEPGA
jgi:small-conductance mechanosensitive channel